MIENILLTATPITTHADAQVLTNATGFFFERSGRLYLVTSRHVLLDEPSGHAPDRIAIELHTDRENLAESTFFSIVNDSLAVFALSDTFASFASDAGNTRRVRLRSGTTDHGSETKGEFT